MFKLLILISFLTSMLEAGKIYLSFLTEESIDKEKIINSVTETFKIECKEISTLSDIEFAYNEKRRQYLASQILSELKKFLPKDAIVLLLIIEKDIYAEGFNYIFGQSYGKVNIVSLFRFKPCTIIDSQKEKNILLSRVIKTVIHEIGHSFGINHCKNSSCVMYFSNWVGDTDKKSDKFCSRCKKFLK